MSDVTRHHAGAYKITYNLSGDGTTMINLGYTETGFDWMIRAAAPHVIREDRFGQAPINALVLGIEAMSVSGSFTWFTANINAALNPQLVMTTGLTRYSPGTQISPGYGNGAGALGRKLTLTRITGNIDDNTLRILPFFSAFARGDLLYKLAVGEITRSPAVFDIYPKVGSAVTGDDGAGTPEPQWFDTPTYGS